MFKLRESFFDEHFKSLTMQHIWDKVKNPPQDNEIEFIENVNKKSRKYAGVTKQITIVLTEEYLLLKKKNQYHGQLYLLMTTLEIIQKDGQKFFFFIRNGQTLEITFNNQENMLKWQNYLSQVCILKSFHEEYSVTKMIGKGSFAKVYFAIKKETGVQYAIKAFNKEFMLEQFRGKESLQNEITIMRKLKHENLVRLYEVHESNNSIYFVIDLLRGGELLNRIKAKGQLNQSDLQKLMLNFLKALNYIHSKNCMHRDLKPENLLLKSKDNDFDLLIADFGLASFTTDANQVIFKRCGTPGFVAPEILNYKDGEKFYDSKCDVFSAGVIFYMLITGKQPFIGSDYKKIIKANKLCQINFLLPSIINSPPSLQDLLQKMLENDPSKRISSGDCLKHEYFSSLAQVELVPYYDKSLNNLSFAEQYFSQKAVESGCFTQSMELQVRKGGLGAQINSTGSMDMVDSPLNKPTTENTPTPIVPSKFNNKTLAKPSQFSNQSPQISPIIEQQASKRISLRTDNNQETLHKKVLKNQINRNHYENGLQKEQQDFDLEDNINDEDPQLDVAILKLKFTLNSDFKFLRYLRPQQVQGVTENQIKYTNNNGQT